MVFCLVVAGVPGAQGSDSSPAVSGAPAVAASEAGAEPIDDVPEMFLGRDPFESAFPRDAVPEPATGLSGDGSTSADLKEFDPSRYNVSGIVWGIEKSRAIINGQIVGVGSVIEDATIRRIDKEGILLDFEGQEVLLKRNMGG